MRSGYQTQVGATYSMAWAPVAGQLRIIESFQLYMTPRIIEPNHNVTGIKVELPTNPWNSEVLPRGPHPNPTMV